MKRLFLLILSVFLQDVFAQIPLREFNLNNQEPLWESVIGGESVSPAVETSYGIAVLTDGRMLSACTNSGSVIWQKSVSGRTSPYLSAFGDFLLVVTDSKKLNMINPSGSTIWTATCPFDICDFPVVGLDGRIFVRGKKGLACYGLNGVRKWKCDTPEISRFPISMLDDGSVVLFLEKNQAGKYVGKRFSPFGEQLEDVIFSDQVLSVLSTKKGIFVALKNSSVGLLCVSDGNVVSKWTKSLPSSKVFSIAYRESSGHTAFFVDGGTSAKTVILDSGDGSIISEISLGSFKTATFQSAKSTTSGFFISDSSKALEFYEDGNILWTALLPDRAKWNTICYTKGNYLFICKKDWSMSTYRMAQTSAYKEVFATPKMKSYLKIRPINSVNNEFGMRTFSSDTFTSISKKLNDGDYGADEKAFLEDIKYEAYNYQASLSSKELYGTKKSYFEADPVYTQNLFHLMAHSGTADFSTAFAALLKSEANLAMTLSLIASSGIYGFDPEGEILRAYEYVLLNKTQPNDVSILLALCDSTYEICRVMGRPAFNKLGKDIISKMMYPQYKNNVNVYARETLEKMMLLEKKL